MSKQIIAGGVAIGGGAPVSARRYERSCRSRRS